MNHAFPEDELRPLSCKPLTRDRENPTHIEVNDVLGNYSLTLIDSLSTLAILASTPPTSKRNQALVSFQDGIRDLVQQYGDGSDGPKGQGLRSRGFDLDSKVQVFETAIRGLGGLISAHLFAVGDLPIRGYSSDKRETEFAKAWHKEDVKHQKGIRWPNGFVYDGQLLRLAHDLGSRLVPAFWTSTGIPYPRVNLRTGIPFYPNSPLNAEPNGMCDIKPPANAEITETCSAGAGSLVLEFTVLSRLTHDDRFEHLAKRAFWSIWARRSEVGLIGAGIDAENGQWIGSWTGVGAGIDSFFEYAFKSHILLSREVHPPYDDVTYLPDPLTILEPLTAEEQEGDAFLRAWDTAHDAIKRHQYRGTNFQHPHYIQVDLTTGAPRGFWIDALSAYYPGLLALAGHVEEAASTHLLTTALWTRFSALPERWSLATGGVEGGLGWWLGRPEFIESTYYLYRATEDPWYFHVGEMVLRDIKRRCWTRCGWAGLQNVLTGEKIDRMESFFLGETAKYLFLLFDPSHPLNHLDEPFVFTTEGHPLVIPRASGSQTVLRSKPSRQTYAPPSTCPVKPAPMPFTISSTAARGDAYHAASLARLHLMPTRDNVESVLGEYAADHPSISVSDITSPSNYTYFPWTLPPSLIPHNATSAPMPAKPTFDISFPTLPNTGTTQATPPLQRVKEGILINFIGGLRLAMIQDVPLSLESDAYRIHAINNLALGKDEKVYLARDTGSGVLNPADPNFTRVRDSTLVEVVIDLDDVPTRPANRTEPEQITTIDLSSLQVEFAVNAEPALKSAWNAMLAHISSLLPSAVVSIDPASPVDAPSIDAVATSSGKRFTINAITPTGAGAAPIPDWPEAVTNLVTSPDTQPLLWETIFATDGLCDHKLPSSVPRNHQVLIVKRGGCSFSQKLANIPSYPASSSALQLVIMVSYEPEPGMPEDYLIRPLLEEMQMVNIGEKGAQISRRNPLVMLMVGGGDRVYDGLARARGLGLKRRWRVETQGTLIHNLIII
jgi:Glycosyl hydrolase family 47